MTPYQTTPPAQDQGPANPPTRWRALAAVFALAWSLRLALALAGGRMHYPDEWRYYTGIRVADALAGGRVADAARELVGAGGHAGFALASLPSLAVQGALRVAAGLRAEQTLWVASVWFTLLSALLPVAVHALARRRGAGPGAALAAAALCAGLTSMTRYGRHLFPYDASLLCLFAGWWLAEDPARRAGRLLAGGGLIGFGLWVYNGHWALALAACGFAGLHHLLSAGPLPRRAGRVALVAAGVLATPLAAALLSSLTGAGMADKLVRHSGAMVGGTPAEGWWIPWAYFWRSEGPLLPVLLAGALLTLRPAARAGRWAALAALAVYALLTLSSSGIGLWPVFGRHARSLLPLLCIAAACGWTALAAAARPGAARAGAALAALALAWNLTVPLHERFPTDVLPAVLRAHPGDVRVFAQNRGQTTPYAEPELLNPAARYVFTNPAVPKPVSGFLPAPAGRLLWAHPHPSQLPYNHFNGYLAHERDWLRREDFRMKLIDTRPDP